MSQSEKLKKLARTYSKKLKTSYAKMHDILSNPDKRLGLHQILEILESSKIDSKQAQGLFLRHYGLSPALYHNDTAEITTQSLSSLQGVLAFQGPLDKRSLADCFAKLEMHNWRVASVHISTQDFLEVKNWNELATIPKGQVKRPGQGYIFDLWGAAVFVDPELPPGRTYFCAEGAVRGGVLDPARVLAFERRPLQKIRPLSVKEVEDTLRTILSFREDAQFLKTYRFPAGTRIKIEDIEQAVAAMPENTNPLVKPLVLSMDGHAYTSVRFFGQDVFGAFFTKSEESLKGRLLTLDLTVHVPEHALTRGTAFLFEVGETDPGKVIRFQMEVPPAL